MISRLATAILVLLSYLPNFALAQICQPDTVVYFGNGVWTEKMDATRSAARMLDAVRAGLSASESCRYDQPAVAYNQTENKLLDILESARQTLGNEYPTLAIAGLLGLLGVDNSLISFVMPDGAVQAFNDQLRGRAVQEFLAGTSSNTNVVEHVALYVSDLQTKRVVLVAHSQGNIFANLSAEKLLQEEPELYPRFAIIPVASPEFSVRKSLVGHIRFSDDLVILAAQVAKVNLGLPVPLEANDEDNVDKDFWSHLFLEAYFSDPSSRSFILNGIIATASGLGVSNQLPIASFSASVGNANTLTVAVGQQITFDPSASRDPDGQVVGYEWDFGDGSGLSVPGPDLQPHTYSTPGPKTVRLIVTDDRGATAPAEVTISVEAIQANYPPVAAFTSTPSVVKVDGIIRVDASASIDPDGTIVTYAWDFGDGQTSSSTTPIHDLAYTAPGTYPIRLTVTDNEGVSSAVTRDIRVTESDPGVVLYDNPEIIAGCSQFLKQGDRYIVTARRGNGLGGNSTDFGHLLLRVSATGVADPTFGNGGTVSISNLIPGLGGIDSSSDLCLGAVDSLGRIVLSSFSLRSAGDPADRAHVIRLTANGVLDTSFADQGIFRFDNERLDQLGTIANRITVDAADRIIVAGRSARLSCPPLSSCPWEGLAFRISADGSLDDNFNDGAGLFTWTDPVVGLQPFIHSYFSGVAVDSLGRILLGGCTSYCANNQGEGYVVRLTPSGALDASFGDGGNRLLPLYNASDPANVTSVPGHRFIDHFSVDSESRIIATGSNYYAGAASLIYRLLPDGALDPTFTYGGALSDFGWARPSMASAPVGQFQRSGKITLVGATAVSNYDDYVAIGRLNADGTPDVSFNQADAEYPSTPAQRAWHLVLGNAFCTEAPGGSFMQPDGRIVIAGTYACGYPQTRGGIYLMRINGDGSIDPTFGQ